MVRRKENTDIAAWGARLIIIFFVAGMFYFPYQAGKKFFQKYKIQSSKIKGIFLATIYFPLGLLINIALFNLVLPSFQKPPPKGGIQDHLFDPAGIRIFLGLFLLGSIIGYISKKYDKPTI